MSSKFFPTDTAIESVLAASEQGTQSKQPPPRSKIRNPHKHGKIDRLPDAHDPWFSPDLAAEPDLTSRQRARAGLVRGPPDGRPWSVTQWCEFVGVSRTSYYQLKKEGKTPDELHVGARRLITREAHERWCRKHTVRARPQIEEQS